MSVQDALIDIESLSLHATNAWILSAGMVIFDPQEPPGEFQAARFWNFGDPPFSDFTPVASRETIDWWFADARANARRQFTSARTDYRRALEELYLMLEPCRYCWARGPQFDLSNLWNQMRYLKVPIPKCLETYQWRDSRTLSELYGMDAYRHYVKGIASGMGADAHHALDDARLEATFVQQCFASRYALAPEGLPAVSPQQ